MYASPYSARNAQPYTSSAMSGMYKSIGVETGVSGATPHQLVSMLFDAATEAISLARTAIRSGHIDTKIQAISKALRIVDEGLKANLNLDSGGELAANLHGLYSYVAVRLTLANLRNDDAVLEECLRLIEPVRLAWQAIAPQANSGASLVGVSA